MQRPRITDVERLQGWFEEGALIRPVAAGPTTVDLIRAVFSICGVDGLPLSPEATELKARIGTPRHLIFLLIDGLGARLLAQASDCPFLKRHKVGELRAVFPSTTAAALTSFATGLYPAQHGIPAWWVYLSDHDLIATVLPFKERFSERSLDDLGVAPSEVFCSPVLLPRMERDTLTVTPKPFLKDVYLRYSTGGTKALGYGEAAEAFGSVIEQIRQADGPSYISVYLPQLDEASHKQGPDSPGAYGTLAALDALAAELHRELRGQARVLCTGDHGQVRLPAERVLVLGEDDTLVERLVCPPAGEATVPFFHLKDPGRVDDFRVAFRERFGDAFALITRGEAEALELFGPSPLSPLMRERLGDLIGIAPRPTALYYRRVNEIVTPFLGVHAGLSRGEMLVPLILA